MPVDNNSPLAEPGSRLRELGLVLPQAPSRATSSGIERQRAASSGIGDSIERDRK